MDDRKLEVLRAIVEDYVATREPVGSKVLAERHNFGVSSATLRNDMAVLEEEGYIVAPHTSAGRVPTDKGYRLFVDRLAQIKPLSPAERRAIHQFLDSAVDLDDVMQRTVRLLAQLTHQVALVQYPTLTRSGVRHVEIVGLGTRRVLLIVIADTGRVEQRTVPAAQLGVLGEHDRHRVLGAEGVEGEGTVDGGVSRPVGKVRPTAAQPGHRAQAGTAGQPVGQRGDPGREDRPRVPPVGSGRRRCVRCGLRLRGRGVRRSGHGERGQCRHRVAVADHAGAEPERHPGLPATGVDESDQSVAQSGPGVQLGRADLGPGTAGPPAATPDPDAVGVGDDQGCP